MAKINILDSSIFNLISAGEVVDKPMSVVKELVENSIDAGATDINIEVRGGGIDFIRVTDNGCGIEKSEMRKAFMPHATSKIKNVEDLNTILTLGFRGEALASIAAVSKVTMTSRTEGEELGQTIIYDAGNVEAEYETGCSLGTTVTVENIFEKIPARQKYLRNPSSEEADIANLITRLIVANPKIAFKYDNGKKQIMSTGENEKSALMAIYGNDILFNLEEISLIMSDITIRGFIGKPSFSKHSRNYQTLVVNGRYVKNDDIAYMIYLCYKDFLMSRQYPMFVIYIDLPADMVDVNVHPSKMDVKFVQTERIKKLLKSLVNAKLNKVALTPKTIESMETSDEFKVRNIDLSIFNERKSLREERAFRSTYAQADFKQNNHFEDNFKPKSVQQYNIEQNKSEDNNAEQNNVACYREQNNFSSSNNILKPIYDNENENFLGEETVMTVGTLFSTYIIVEQGENCYLIDQHAAHERILYDKFVKQIEGKPMVQSLLFPYEFSLSYDESALLDANMEIFSQCGFEIEKRGDKEYSINAVPAVADKINLSQFIPTFFDAIRLNSVNKAMLIKDTLAQSACKAAIKGDRLLSPDEIKYLIRGMNTLDALLCPHGRPIVVKLTKTEVDKWFKRK